MIFPVYFSIFIDNNRWNLSVVKIILAGKSGWLSVLGIQTDDHTNSPAEEEKSQQLTAR